MGVLGGMGPLAGATFVTRLAQLTPAATDQDHIAVLLRKDPRIPDRSAARLRGGADPLPAMREGLEFLVRSGVDCIAIPCNTAHLWFEALKDSVPAPLRLLHIAEAVIEDLREREIVAGPIGIMATRATLESGLYQAHLAAAGYAPMELHEHEVERYCGVAIEAVKTNRLDDAFLPAADGIRALAKRGARAVVLGCTELPLAVTHRRRREFGIPLSDSIDALALAAIRHFTGRDASHSLSSGALVSPATVNP